jgi:hypothetical protein
MSLFTTYLEQVKTEMNPDEMALKKLAMEVVSFNSDFISKDKTSPNLKEFVKFLFYKLAVKSTKLNTIQLWEKIDKVFNNIRHNFSNTYSVILGKNNTPESEIKRAQRIFDDKFIEDNKIPFFTKLAEEKTNNKQLIKKIIRDIWG